MSKTCVLQVKETPDNIGLIADAYDYGGAGTVHDSVGVEFADIGVERGKKDIDESIKFDLGEEENVSVVHNFDWDSGILSFIAKVNDEEVARIEFDKKEDL